MKKVLVVGGSAFCQTFKQILSEYPDISATFCEYDEYGNKWRCDPLDTFLNVEPALVLISYDAYDENKSYWFGPWKEIALAATPDQMIRRLGWFPVRDIRWVVDGSTVREKNADEVVTDFIRLPPDPGDFRKFLQQ